MRFSSETSFGELCRQATNKSLRGPDADLNGMVGNSMEPLYADICELYRLVHTNVRQRALKVHVCTDNIWDKEWKSTQPGDQCVAFIEHFIPIHFPQQPSVNVPL